MNVSIHVMSYTAGSWPEYRASTGCAQESIWSCDVKVAEFWWLSLHLWAVQVHQTGSYCKQLTAFRVFNTVGFNVPSWSLLPSPRSWTVLTLLTVSAFHSSRQFETSLLCWCMRLMPELLWRRSVNSLTSSDPVLHLFVTMFGAGRSWWVQPMSDTAQGSLSRGGSWQSSWIHCLQDTLSNPHW